MRVVGKMSKDIGMGVRKGTVVSFVPTLFGYFFEDSIPICLHLKKNFGDLFPLFCFFGGGGGEQGYGASY